MRYLGHISNLLLIDMLEYRKNYFFLKKKIITKNLSISFIKKMHLLNPRL